MNYLYEIKAFYNRLNTRPLNSSAIVLWHALMTMANQTGWRETFTAPASVLLLRTGLSMDSLKRARKKLTDEGLIEWKKGQGKQAPTYKLKSLATLENTRDCGTSAPTTAPLSAPLSAPTGAPSTAPLSAPSTAPIIKTKLKQNNNNILPPISPTANRFNDFFRAYPKKVHTEKAYEAYMQTLFDDQELEEGNLTQAAVNYSEAVKIQETPERYILNPENFLSKGVYSDYLPGNYKKPQSKPKKVDINQGMIKQAYDFEELERKLNGL